uniref:uroporphyrinogen-III synthase n=1 Tax=Anaerovibrio sp. TaxID=1872532 RepID=UPI00388F9510
TTPVAIIRWGTKLKQQVWTSTLAEAADMAQPQNIKPPCIFLVGEVVKLRQDLAWFDNVAMKPLFGKKILVTRSRAQASKLTRQLEELGAECIEAPAISLKAPADAYRSLDKALGGIDKYNWLIFTSTNGVDHFWQRLEKAGKDARALASAKLCAIGSATAEALKQHGLIADVVPDRYQAEGIIEALKDMIKPGIRVLIPRAAQARAILPESLRKAGAEVAVVPAYETAIGEGNSEEIRQELQKGNIDAVTFTSSSTVTNFLKLLGGDTSLLNKVKLCAIGPITAETMRKNGLSVSVEAAEYTIDGLVEALKEAF